MVNLFPLMFQKHYRGSETLEDRNLILTQACVQINLLDLLTSFTFWKYVFLIIFSLSCSGGSSLENIEWKKLKPSHIFTIFVLKERTEKIGCQDEEGLKHQNYQIVTQLTTNTRSHLPCVPVTLLKCRLCAAAGRSLQQQPRFGRSRLSVEPTSPAASLEPQLPTRHLHVRPCPAA